MTDKEYNVEDFKYFRLGYYSRDRKSDRLLEVFRTCIPGDGELPKRWFHRGIEHFVAYYGHLGHTLWAPATSSQLLLVGGHKVLRVWVDAKNSCYVDLSDALAGLVRAHLTVQDIPAGNARKCAPFTKRVRICQQWQAQSICDEVVRQYGLDSA